MAGEKREDLREAEALIEYIANNDAPSGVAMTMPEGAIAAVLAMRDAIAAEKLTPEIERAFIETRVKLSAAVKPATIEGIRAHQRGATSIQYRRMRVLGAAVFVVLVTAFLGFTLVGQSMKMAATLNEEIERITKDAANHVRTFDCGALGGLNYEVNQRKEKILIAYQNVRWMSNAMALRVVDLLNTRPTLSIELYREQLMVTGQGDARRCDAPGAADPTANRGPVTIPPPDKRRQLCLALVNGGTRHANVDCGHQEVEQLGQAILRSYGDLLLPMLFGTYGAFVAVRRRTLWRIRERSLTHDIVLGYWLRIGIGAFFGGFLAHVLPTVTGDPLVSKLPPFALAFLAGYRADLLLDLLDKIMRAAPSGKESKGTAATSQS
jgi:hypothetical protein